MTPPGFSAAYRRLPGLVLGFHGCDRQVGEDLLCGKKVHLSKSENKYDWLGDGVYFWEGDPQRAWEFAQEASHNARLTRGAISEPFVLGAVIDLGLCLNLTDRRGLDELARAHTVLGALRSEAGASMPQNTGKGMYRVLDCSVIMTLHQLRQGALKDGALPAYDTVRSPFPEGDLLYEGAGFRAKNHIQIAVRNLDCIKGYFRPIPDGVG